MPVKSLFRLITLCLLMLAVFACASGGGSGERGLTVVSDVQVFPQVSGDVYYALFSPDNRYVATAGYDKAVKIWEAETGVLVKSFYGHEESVYCLAWSPDGKFIASGSMDGAIKLWDTGDFSSPVRELHTLKLEKAIGSLSFSPDSRYLASCSGTMIQIWDASTGRKIKELSGHQENIQSVVFSPDGKRIASASRDKTIRIWDAERGTSIQTYTGHTDLVRSVTWSPDGTFLASASADRTVRKWNIATNAVQIIGQGIFDATVTNAQFSPDSKYIVTANGFRHGRGQNIVIWDAATCAEIRRFSEHTNSVVTVNWNSNGKYIITASTDTTAKMYDAQTGKCLQTFSGKTDSLREAVLSRDGKYLVTGSQGERVNIWNVQTGVLERSLEHSGEVYAVAVSPDSSLLAAGAMGLSDQLKIWDIETGNELQTLKGHSNTVFALAFNPVSGHLISASGDKTIRIWDTGNGRELAVISEDSDVVDDIAFSTDGKRFVSASRDKSVGIWESINEITGQYRLLRTFTGHTDHIYSVAISSNGKKVVSGSIDGTVRVWDIETGGADIIKTAGSHVFYSVAFSPDDRSILASTNSNEIYRWEIGTDKTLTNPVKKLLGTARSLSYSSDGQRIIAGIDDGTARLYDAKNLSEIASFVYFTGEDAQTASTGRGLTVEAKQAVSQIDGDWLTITPDGYYRGSIRGDRFINVLINGRDLTTMDAYSDIFHKPEVVHARLLGQPDPVDTKINIQQAASFRPPVVTIQSPTTGTTVTGQGMVNLFVNITDQNLPIKDIRILVNGVRIGSDELKAVNGTNGITAEEGGLSVSGNTKTVQFTVPVSLVESGSNRIEVMAYNGYSWGYSGDTRSVNVNWQPSPGMQVPLPNLWILAIGVNKYNHEMIPNLNFCDNDARRLVESFRTQEGKRFGSVNYRLLVDGEIEPTAANVRANLSFLEQAGQRDVVLLFLAGHGISEGDRFYFLTKDAVLNGNKIDPNYALSDETLKSVLDAPGRRMIFIDACQSGGMDIDGFMYSLRRTNAYMLSSSEGNRPSYEDDPRSLIWDRHGVFTYSVIRGLSGMARPRNDASISVLQLSGYVRNTVMNLTANKPYQQRPIQYSWGFSDFDIAR